MNMIEREKSQENTEILDFDPYKELSLVIERAYTANYPKDHLISTLVFTTEELARVSNNLDLLGGKFE